MEKDSVKVKAGPEEDILKDSHETCDHLMRCGWADPKLRYISTQVEFELSQSLMSIFVVTSNECLHEKL